MTSSLLTGTFIYAFLQFLQNARTFRLLSRWFSVTEILRAVHLVQIVLCLPVRRFSPEAPASLYDVILYNI